MFVPRSINFELAQVSSWPYSAPPRIVRRALDVLNGESIAEDGEGFECQIPLTDEESAAILMIVTRASERWCSRVVAQLPDIYRAIIE